MFKQYREISKTKNLILVRTLNGKTYPNDQDLYMALHKEKCDIEQENMLLLHEIKTLRRENQLFYEQMSKQATLTEPQENFILLDRDTYNGNMNKD